MKTAKSNVRFVLICCMLVAGSVLAPSAGLAFVHQRVLSDTIVSTTSDSTYTQVDVMAEYPGGMEA